MHKLFLILVVLVLFGSYQVAGQATSTKTQPLTNINNPKNPRTFVTVIAASTEPNAEAKGLFEEGMKLAEAGQFSQAAEKFQQALKLEPEYADAYAALGRAYFKMRQWQKASDNLRRAAALRTKQREAQDALQRKLTMEKREEASTPVKAAPTSPRIKLPQENKVIAAGGKTLSPKSETTRQTGQREESSTPNKATPTSPRIKLPQENKVIAAGGKTLSPKSGTTRQTGQREEASTLVKAAPRSPQTILPQENKEITAGVKAVSPKSETTRQPQQRDEAGTPVKVTPASSQIKLPQENKAIAAGVKALSPESETTRQAGQREESSTPKNVSPASPHMKLPQEINANAAGVKAPSAKAETTRRPEQQEEASIPVKSAPTSPETKLQQPVKPNAAGVKPVRSESETTRQPEETAASVPQLKSDDDNAFEQIRELVGVRVAMSVTPASTPVETKSISPISTAASRDEVSLTKIYRVGPSDVLDVRINDSQSPQSTLFTVTPSGLLEHPMLPEPLLVTGFIVEEIGTKIENDLKKRALIDDPKVVVGVRDYASHTILVSGLVKDSGTKFLRREAIPLYVVVADAQPLPEAATVTLVRNELNQIYEIDLRQTADMNLLVRPGDVITLHPNVTQFVYIGGEVKFPGEKTYRRGLTLMQAMIAAGGVTPKSKVAEIGRDDGRGFLIGTRFNLQDIVSGKTGDPLLRPGDRIMILR